MGVVAINKREAYDEQGRPLAGGVCDPRMVCEFSVRPVPDEIGRVLLTGT
jgi:hypothetical protein